jgi:uncharacterized membrane protein YbhN (UPF0104 family)
MSRYAEAAKRLVSVTIVVGVAFFFYRAVRRNWGDIQAAQLKLDYPLLLIAAVLMLICYLLSTYAWQLTINGLSERKLTMRQSVAAVNGSGLTKYLPGKFWSYALQMYWLGAAGFSKSLILYANIVNLVIACITSLVFGCLGLALTSHGIPPFVTWPALVVVLLVDIAIIRLYSPAFSLLVSLANRLFKRDIQYFQLPLRLNLELHALYFGSAIASALSAYVVCFAVGYRIGPNDGLLVASSSLIADFAGFVAFIVPGGLGVRESAMFLLLNGISLGSLPLVLPIATRAVNMVVDVVLGGMALKLLRKYSAEGWGAP